MSFNFLLIYCYNNEELDLNSNSLHKLRRRDNISELQNS